MLMHTLLPISTEPLADLVWDGCSSNKAFNAAVKQAVSSSKSGRANVLDGCAKVSIVAIGRNEVLHPRKFRLRCVADMTLCTAG
jgi:hypothetical protein